MAKRSDFDPVVYSSAEDLLFRPMKAKEEDDENLAQSEVMRPPVLICNPVLGRDDSDIELEESKAELRIQPFIFEEEEVKSQAPSQTSLVPSWVWNPNIPEDSGKINKEQPKKDVVDSHSNGNTTIVHVHPSSVYEPFVPFPQPVFVNVQAAPEFRNIPQFAQLCPHIDSMQPACSQRYIPPSAPEESAFQPGLARIDIGNGNGDNGRGGLNESNASLFDTDTDRALRFFFRIFRNGMGGFLVHVFLSKLFSNYNLKRSLLLRYIYMSNTLRILAIGIVIDWFFEERRG